MSRGYVPPGLDRREDAASEPRAGAPGGATAGAVMLRNPKTLPDDASVVAAREALAGDHVHMVLLTDQARLRGTLVEGDLPAGIAGDRPALPFSTLAGRTVPPETPADHVQQLLIERGTRRMAVADAHGTLLGLTCLKRRGAGFCSDADVTSRAEARASDRPEH